MNFPGDLRQPQGRAPGCTHGEREGSKDETHELSNGFVPASRESPWLQGADVEGADALSEPILRELMVRELMLREVMLREVM